MKKVTLIPASWMVCITSGAKAGMPSSMAKAKLLGRVQAKKRGAVGTLVGIKMPRGMVGTISTSVNMVGLMEASVKDFKAIPIVRAWRIEKWDKGMKISVLEEER